MTLINLEKFRIKESSKIKVREVIPNSFYLFKSPSGFILFNDVSKRLVYRDTIKECFEIFRTVSVYNLAYLPKNVKELSLKYKKIFEFSCEKEDLCYNEFAKLCPEILL